MIEGSVGVRRRRSITEAMSLVTEYEASGLSRRVFCSARGLAVATLDLYRKRAREGAARSGGAVPQQLVAVEIERGREAPRSSALTVVLRSGRRIEVGGAFDAALLSELLVVLEQA
jgi:hypothetical protein